MLDFLTSLEAMDLPDRIEEVNAKILQKIIEDTDFVAVLFCEYKLFSIPIPSYVSLSLFVSLYISMFIFYFTFIFIYWWIIFDYIYFKAVAVFSVKRTNKYNSIIKKHLRNSS